MIAIASSTSSAIPPRETALVQGLRSTSTLIARRPTLRRLLRSSLTHNECARSGARRLLDLGGDAAQSSWYPETGTRIGVHVPGSFDARAGFPSGTRCDWPFWKEATSFTKSSSSGRGDAVRFFTRAPDRQQSSGFTTCWHGIEATCSPYKTWRLLRGCKAGWTRTSSGRDRGRETADNSPASRTSRSRNRGLQQALPESRLQIHRPVADLDERMATGSISTRLQDPGTHLHREFGDPQQLWGQRAGSRIQSRAYCPRDQTPLSSHELPGDTRTDVEIPPLREVSSRMSPRLISSPDGRPPGRCRATSRSRSDSTSRTFGYGKGPSATSWPGAAIRAPGERGRGGLEAKTLLGKRTSLSMPISSPTSRFFVVDADFVFVEDGTGIVHRGRLGVDDLGSR